jgi:hypothetical protein
LEAAAEALEEVVEIMVTVGVDSVTDEEVEEALDLEDLEAVMEVVEVDPVLEVI